MCSREDFLRLGLGPSSWLDGDIPATLLCYPEEERERPAAMQEKPRVIVREREKGPSEDSKTTGTIEANSRVCPSPFIGKLAEAPLCLKPPPSSGELASLLTVLVFTSPIPSHPSLEMVMTVIESFKFIPGLSECPLLVTCDGAGKVCGEVRPKKGFVTAELHQKYNEYVKKLQEALGSERVLVLPEREGFGRAVKAAVSCVKTPYLMIVQHDNMFVRPIDLVKVLNIMTANKDTLKCVHFVSPKSTYGDSNDGEKSNGKTSQNLQSIEDRLGKLAGSARGFDDGKGTSPITCWPMPSWLERNHVCLTEQYRDFVLGPDTKLKPGQFIEETFGQRMRKDLEAGGDHKRYGIYRLLDTPEPASLHLDGRAFLPVEEIARRGWKTSDLYQRLEARHKAWLNVSEGGSWKIGEPMPQAPPLAPPGSAKV
eukprot:TRINITY_DN47974_c0_g1_i1.p1 TRINITY_DN47974_c0_g1~~TRINITY_DN47974_c0_g1_i1.p1  ORF type:complete len:426 (-),score=71.33 TRINITY_DN47974_c0_g1_i1:37-1314(-)